MEEVRERVVAALRILVERAEVSYDNSADDGQVDGVTYFDTWKSSELQQAINEAKAALAAHDLRAEEYL